MGIMAKTGAPKRSHLRKEVLLDDPAQRFWKNFPVPLKGIDYHFSFTPVVDREPDFLARGT